MNSPETNHLQKALYRILRPLARLLLRNGITYAEFSDLVKRAYVDSAMTDFREGTRKQTDSRAAVLTGLTRKEVKRQRELLAGERPDARVTRHISRASRVVSGWVQDEHFHDASGEPAALPFDGERSFAGLVRRYSGDMTPRAVLDELQRVGVVAPQTQAGTLYLKQRAYVPAGDDEEMLHIFGEDVSDLVTTIDHNLMSRENGHPPLYQRTLTYNNVPPEVIERWRAYAAGQSQALLEKLDEWLGPYDRDSSGSQAPADGQETVRTGVSVFYFEEPVQPGDNGEQK